MGHRRLSSKSKSVQYRRTKCDAAASPNPLLIAVGCAPTKSVDFGAMGGLGLDRVAGPNEIVSLDVLYTLGLTSIVGYIDLKNRAFTIRVGLGVPLG